ncbi:hypothetical protein KQI52_06805 [bacterium]|nr:hypothetical protein [bacterium]
MSVVPFYAMNSLLRHTRAARLYVNGLVVLLTCMGLLVPQMHHHHYVPDDGSVGCETHADLLPERHHHPHLHPHDHLSHVKDHAVPESSETGNADPKHCHDTYDSHHNINLIVVRSVTARTSIVPPAVFISAGVVADVDQPERHGWVMTVGTTPLPKDPTPGSWNPRGPPSHA